MPLPINIDDLLHGKAVEWERLESKRGWNPLGVLHTLCAFANDFRNLGGGYLVLGVEEKDGRPVLPPVGLEVDQLDAIQKELLNLGHSALQPAYHPIVVPATVEGRSILILWAPGGQTRSYKARLSLGKDGKDYGYFIRRGSSTVRAKGPDETELLSLAATGPFDDRINQGARVEDFSRELMQDYLKQVGSDLAEPAPSLSVLELGRQMGVVGGPDEAPLQPAHRGVPQRAGAHRGACHRHSEDHPRHAGQRVAGGRVRVRRGSQLLHGSPARASGSAGSGYRGSRIRVEARVEARVALQTGVEGGLGG